MLVQLSALVLVARYVRQNPLCLFFFFYSCDAGKILMILIIIGDLPQQRFHVISRGMH